MLDVLEAVEAGAFLAPTLSATLDRARLSGPDRSLVTDLAYGVARWRLYLDAALAPYLQSPGRLPPRVIHALRAGAFELLVRRTPPHAAVSTWVQEAKGRHPRLGSLVNAVLRRVAGSVAEPPAVTTDPATAVALPAWLWSEFETALGDDAEAAARGMLEPEPLWLTAFSSDAEASLVSDGSEVRAGPLPPGVPTSLSVRAARPLAALAAYQVGLVQPQNPASLYAALALGARTGERVVDLASGRGVKSAVLAASGADVTAVEIDPRRSAAARQNLARLGLSVEHLTADLLAGPVAGIRPQSAARVLLDAPCSGTGTLRGHPEIKLRLAPDDIVKLAMTQRALLTAAADLVAPGGALLYAVCSLTQAEGPAIAAAFAAEHKDFRPAPLDCPLPHRPAGPGGLFVLSTGGLDGFFLAKFERA